MFAPWGVLNRSHLATSMCTKGAERKLRQWVWEEAQYSMEATFQDYGWTLESGNPFKYLGRVLTASNDNWLDLVANLRKAWKKWERLYRILGREGADARTTGTDITHTRRVSYYFYPKMVNVKTKSGKSWLICDCDSQSQILAKRYANT